VIQKFFRIRGVRLRDGSPSVGALYRQNINIAWPATLEGALMSIIGSVNTIMVGGLGAAAIAAVGLTNQPRMILLILAQALCVGTTALVARRKGAEDRAAANACLGQSMTLVTVLGVLMTLSGFFFARPLMDFAGANEDTLEMSTGYFQIVSLGFIFNCWQLCICAAMRAIGQTKVTLVTNITANLVNVFLNFCLIEGRLGFPAMGVRGSALATVVGSIVASAIAFYFVIHKEGYLKLTLRSMIRFDRLTMQGLVRVGSSSMAESAFLRIGFLITTKLIAGMGTAAMASYQIVSQIASLSFTLGDGIAAAGASLVGQSLGAQRPDLARFHVGVSRKLSIIVSSLLILTIFLLRNQIAMLFTDEADIIWGVTLSFYVVLAGMYFQNGRIVDSGCLRGAGDVKYVALCSFVSVLLVRPVLTWFLCYPLNSAFPVLQLSVTGPWAAFFIDSITRYGMLSHRIKQGKWLEIKL